MKYLCLFFLCLMQLSDLRGQNNDSIEYCIIKYRYINFITNNSQIKPLTLFMQQNGNFFLQNGHLNKPAGGASMNYSFNNKGKLLKQSREKFENIADSSTVIQVVNYIPENYNKFKISYLQTLIEEFSIILQGFNEPLLYHSSDSNMFRIVFPCYNYMGDYNNKYYQHYNLVRVHFHDKIFIFKIGHFDQNSNFVIDFDYTYHLNSKEIKQIQKIYEGIDLGDENIYYRKNFSRQRLFEFKKKGNYYMFLRADSYEGKIEDLSYFNGLLNKLYYIATKRFYKQIYKCK